MQGDLNKAPLSPTHTHNHTCVHTLSSILTHIIYAGEKKYINICITKQYKGLSVVKYLFCQIKMCLWAVASFCLMYAKLSLPLPSTKYLFLIY